VFDFRNFEKALPVLPEPLQYAAIWRYDEIASDAVAAGIWMLYEEDAPWPLAPKTETVTASTRDSFEIAQIA
jgi:hypothetical protein